ncbi:MAG: hypothetical protein ABGY41_18110, partial [Candidatus Poribacteria bacterium]
MSVQLERALFAVCRCEVRLAETGETDRAILRERRLDRLGREPVPALCHDDGLARAEGAAGGGRRTAHAAVRDEHKAFLGEQQLARAVELELGRVSKRHVQRAD